MSYSPSGNKRGRAPTNDRPSHSGSATTKRQKVTSGKQQPEDESYYMLQCCDYDLPISSDNLDKMCSELPLLSFLLFGHPQMQRKDIQRNDLGWKVLTLPYFLQITRKEFNRLMSLVLRNQTPSPSSSTSIHCMMELVNKLGGCPSLEERFSKPRRIEDDLNDDFIWRLEDADISNTSSTDYVQLQEEEGWQLVGLTTKLKKHDRIGYGGYADENRTAVVLRKKRADGSAAANDKPAAQFLWPSRPKEDVAGKFHWRWESLEDREKITNLQVDEGWQLLGVDRSAGTSYDHGYGANPYAVLRKKKKSQASSQQQQRVSGSD